MNNGKIYATIMIAIWEYRDRDGQSPFGRWFARLNAEAARKVTTALYRLGQGNFSNVKGIGSGVFEHRIDFGPGYRVYFGKDGDSIVILLGGGTKHLQQKDIRYAVARWEDYKQRKKRQKPEEV